MNNKTYIDVNIKVGVSDSDIDDIMVTALEGGIEYWCSEVKVVGERLGIEISDQISMGGSLLISSDGDMVPCVLSKDNFLKGLVKYLSGHHECLYEGGIDLSCIDAGAADCIIQYALFDEIVFA